jgi:crooked neck
LSLIIHLGAQGEVKRSLLRAISPLLPTYQPHLPVVGLVTTDKDLVTEYRRDNLNIWYRGNAVQISATVREVYEKWIKRNEKETTYLSYIDFEMERGQIERVRGIFCRLIEKYKNLRNFTKFIEFEENNGEYERAEEIFGAIKKSINGVGAKYYVEYIGFKLRRSKLEEAEKLLMVALNKYPEDIGVFASNLSHEWKFKDKYGLEMEKFQILKLLREELFDFDLWIFLLEREESYDHKKRCFGEMERAFFNFYSNKGVGVDDTFLNFMIYYACLEDGHARGDHAEMILDKCVNLTVEREHVADSLWICYLRLLVKRERIGDARLSYGKLIGIFGSELVIKEYIEMERQLGEYERVRRIYNKHLELYDKSIAPWMEYASFEESIGEYEKAELIHSSKVRAYWEIQAIRSYAEFLVRRGSLFKLRNLFEDVLQEMEKVKVWTMYLEYAIKYFSEGSSIKRLFQRAIVFCETREQSSVQDVKKIWEDYNKVGSAPKLNDGLLTQEDAAAPRDDVSALIKMAERGNNDEHTAEG